MYAPRPRSPGPEQRPPPAAPGWHQFPPPPPPPPPHAPTSQATTAPPQPNGAYHPSSAPPATTLPPLSDHRSDMALHHPHPPPSAQYRYPHDPFGRPPPPPDPYARPPPHAYPQHPQPAPRQRTAIACRYCRRRKIRCSGFDSSEDGRCSNCQRFSQECVFTPVSAQTQAFVPAHAVYRNGAAPPTQLYGAYGQPLPAPHHDPYARPTPYTLPSPTGPYSHAPSPAGAPPPTAYAPLPAAPPAVPPAAPPAAPPAHYDDRNGVNGVSRKRSAGEPHTPTLPPPNPGPSSALPRTLAPDLNHDYHYPDPAGPSGSTAYQQTAATTTASSQPYYASQPPVQRASPVLAPPFGSHDRARTSSSPNQPAPVTPGSGSYGHSSAEPWLQPPATALPIRGDGRSPPPPSSTPLSASLSASAPPSTNSSIGRPSMSINNLIVGDGASPGDRSTTDKSMLARLGK